MLGRIAITAAVWLIGVLFAFMLDGQAFTHGLALIGCAVVGSLPWIPLASQREDARRRFGALVLSGLSAAVIVGVSLHLPADYEHQQKFNERAATPARSTHWTPPFLRGPV